MSGNDGNEMSKDEVLRQLREQADSIGRRLAELEAESEPKRRPRARLLGRSVAASMVICALLIGVTAVAQQSEQLITFQPGTPARADQINGNFQLLKRWIERKVGDVDANCTDGNCSASVQGDLSVGGTLSVGGSSLDNRIDNRIRDWVRGHCRVMIGWRDDCGPNCSAPYYEMASRADGTCVNPFPDDPATPCEVGYSALQYSAEVGRNDVAYLRFECD